MLPCSCPAAVGSGPSMARPPTGRWPVARAGMHDGARPTT